MKVSVVCPFYNESTIIENAMQQMIASLETLPYEWELLAVNDGSKDESFALARQAAAGHPKVRVIGYENNCGRGYALRHGISNATGDVVVTTEIDLSWGEDIVHRLAQAFVSHPDADMIVASPNLEGGGYRNVPFKRVFLSRLGNRIIRIGQSRDMTMYTGMTRGYRRDAFLSLPIDENEKEFHLEVAQKAQTFGFKIYEIPCVLEWKDHRLAKPNSAKRKSSSKIKKLVKTHMAFAAVAAPVRYILPLSLFICVVAFFFIAGAIVNLFNEQPSAYLLIAGLTIFIIGLLAFAVGMLSYQGQLLQRDLWRLRRDIIQYGRAAAEHRDGDAEFR